MISFIVVGRNEGWKLSKCIQSIINTIEFNKLQKHEIVYVDSNSTDNSIERAKEFGCVKIFKLTGEVNAAIARNIGTKHSKGEVLFFIDGDMEIMPEFLKIVYSKEEGLIDNFVSGNWINYYFNNHSDDLIRKEKFKSMERDTIEKVTGGLFLINRNTWDLVGGMNNKFKRSQDIDLGLRLAKKGIFLVRKKEIAAIHYTVDYLNKERMWKDFVNWNHLYAKSFLYRNHIFNKHVYNRILTNDYTAMLLILCILAVLFSSKIAIVAFSLYIIVVVLRSKFSLKNVLYFFLRDLSVILGLFIFFPKKPIFRKIKIY